jgi:hypothetical protein
MLPENHYPRALARKKSPPSINISTLVKYPG